MRWTKRDALRLKGWLIASLGSLAFGFAPKALALQNDGPPSCWTEKPVLELATQLIVSGPSVVLGPFQLPLSPERPDILTAAQISWNWELKSNRAAEQGLVVTLAFPDPKPFGLPYTVQGFSIETQDSTYFRDWTFGCENVGISLFPGGSWQQVIDLEDDQLAPNPTETILIKVWGSRN